MVPAESHSAEWHRKMARALQAGVYYFACVFAVGFLLGITRALLVAPRTGELLAAEVVLSVLVFVNSLNQYLDSPRTAHGLTGLAGQLVFGFIPLLQLPWRQPGD